MSCFLIRKLFAFVLLFLLLGSMPAIGSALINGNEWVVDQGHYLSVSKQSSLDKWLKGIAENRGISVRVLLLERTHSPFPLEDTLTQWESAIPDAFRGQTAFLVINPHTRQSRIVLGDKIVRTQALLNCVQRIQEDLVNTALRRGHWINALYEGVNALTTVLDTKTLYTDSKHGAASATHPPRSPSFLFVSLQIIVVIGALIGVAFGFRRYFSAPHWQTQEFDMAQIEEEMLLSKLAAQARQDQMSGLYQS